MSTPQAGTHRVRLTSLLPYIIALAALGWVFWTTDLDRLKAALAHAPFTLFVLFSAAILLANCAADTFAMHRVFGWFGCHVRYRDLLVIRASTYLLAVLNYHLGQAAIVGYLSRARGVPIRKASGWILFIIGINVGTLFLLASVGATKAQGELAILRLIPIASVAGAITWAILLRLRPRILAERRVLAPLFEMGVAGHVKGVLVRLPHVGVLCLWHFVSLRLFSIEVPVLDALMFLPIYFAAASLPLNVNGIGVAQIVAVTFFAPYSRDPSVDGRTAVIAYSLSTSVVSMLLQLGLGLACIRRATRLGLPHEAPEEIEAQAAAAAIHD
jgi:hypothetical protein